MKTSELFAAVLLLLATCAACGSEPEWRLGIGGDTVLARGVENTVRTRNDPGAPFGDMIPVLRDLDLLFCNLECQISDVGARIQGGSKTWYFRARPEMVRSLAAAGVDVVTVANNHGMDYGPRALRQTLALLQENGIVAVGGGVDLDQAGAPGVVRVAGRDVAFVGLNTTPPLMRAGPDKPGLHAYPHSPPDDFLAAAKSSWERASRVADVVLFTVHWGPNYGEAPTDAQRRLARDVLDLGYTGFIGHGAHRFHGVEIHDGKPIIHDAGNFVVDFAPEQWNDRNMLFILHFKGNEVDRLEAVPISRVGAITRFAEPTVAAETCARLMALSAALGTNAERTEDDRVLIRMRP